MNLESLEAREVPAAYWWSPVNLNANGVYSSPDPQNWLKGSGFPYVRYAQSEPGPGPTDDLYYLGGLSSNDCTIPQPSYTVNGVAFAGLHLLFGPISLNNGNPGTPGVPLPPPPPPVAYTGTVTTAGSFTVGTLEVECGQISQGSITVSAGNGSTLTVKTTFDWTGGTLNSNTVAGTISLAPGATGTAEPSFTNPGINGTVYLGSTLELQGTAAVFPLPSLGSTLTIYEGDYELQNSAAGFVVQNQSLLHIKAPVPKQYAPPPTTTGKIELNKKDNLIDQVKKTGIVDNAKGGTVVVEAEHRPENNTDAALVSFSSTATKDSRFTNAGTVILKDRAWLTFDHTDTTTTGGYEQNSTDDDPVTLIEAGCKITCSGRSDVVIARGSLALTELKDGTGTPLEDQPNVTIVGSGNQDMEFAFTLADEAFIAWASNRTSVPIRLKVEGAVRWDGTVCLFASDLALKNDSLVATGKIQVGTAAHLEVKWFESPVGDGVHLWDTWHLVEAQEINRKPQCNLDRPPGGIVGQFDLVDDKAIDMTYVQ